MGVVVLVGVLLDGVGVGSGGEAGPASTSEAGVGCNPVVGVEGVAGTLTGELVGEALGEGDSGGWDGDTSYPVALTAAVKASSRAIRRRRLTGYSPTATSTIS